ncbi:MAG: exodeoxyribonuclease V subunit gamma [Gemmatimonadaceae bacterium]
MPHLTIVSSDRPTTLIAQLALDLGRVSLGPFSDETIVVQSRGTERWIRHDLARRHGCAANLRFPFAASFFRALATSLSTEDEQPNESDRISSASTRREDDAFARDTLTWRILDLLENGLAAEQGFEPLRAFVGTLADHDTRKLLGLARTVAGRFSEYQLYRPDVLLAWESGDDATDAYGGPAAWQALLWRRLCATHAPDDHIARLYLEAIERLNAATSPPPNLPTRLSVFGVNTLPPVFVRLLHAVARHLPVRVYLQSPPRRTWRILPSANDACTPTLADNPLFATFGSVVRQFVVLLEQHAPAGMPVVWDEHHHSDVGTASSILSHVQSDIRSGIHRGPDDGLESPIILDNTTRDDSLAIHRCHSPMREMEVLRDQLLAAFAADPTLRPHDVLLVVTDIATYAPFVEAVFGVGEPSLPFIPHRIADRPIVQESRIADAALRLLRLVGARWTAAEVIEILDLPAVQRAAGIPDGATGQIIRWIEETHIRWGRDGAMRREIFGLPAVEVNSWRAGIDRLLMGYATGRTDELVADVLPYAGDTVGDPATLGAFAQFTDRLFDTLTDWRNPRPLAEWSVALRSAFTELLATEDEDEERELESVLAAVDALATMETEGHCMRALELPVVRDWLEQALDDDAITSGFLSGGMTVCALKPMRLVPHRIVALAGLDDATFPRGHHRPAFDMMATMTRDGDRDRRADDRQLFLDTLLATEQRLILSYVAASAKTNAERASSVVVAELLDVVDRSFVTRSHDAKGRSLPARALIEVKHRLQPFSPAYFTGEDGGDGALPRLFSYSRVNASALGSVAVGERERDAPFITGPLAALDSGTPAREIRFEDLIACWTNPSRFFCDRALGIRLPGEQNALDECEPMTVNRLDGYKVHDVMLRRHLAGNRVPARERAEALALGNLPSGALAGAWFDQLDDELAAMLLLLGTPAFEEPHAISVTGATWTLGGRIEGITGDGRLQVRPAKCNPKDRIRAWITHLVLTAAHGPVTTRLIGKDGGWTFAEVAEPLRILDTLVEGYRAALQEPIPFFTQASYCFADCAYAYDQAAAGGKATRRTKSPMDSARDAYDGSEFGEWKTGDRADAYVALCWRGREPLVQMADQFAKWSMAFWRPALAAMKKEGDA